MSPDSAPHARACDDAGQSQPAAQPARARPRARARARERGRERERGKEAGEERAGERRRGKPGRPRETDVERRRMKRRR
eukprot:2524543-Rhodomonas_salina.1